ncbi:MAG TPA: FecR family protein [Vicinamibacterales bacterium]
MKITPDDRLDAYLWDPAAPPDPAVVELERRLSPIRFDPAARPLPQHSNLAAGATVASHSRRRWTLPLAAAAALVLAIAIYANWRWSWPDSRPWPVTTTAGRSDPLAVGNTLRTSADSPALVRVARIGTMRVEGNSAVTLRETRGGRHRLVLRHGTVHVRVWAPPFSVGFQTPAGEVRDLGCEFELTARDGTTRVRVTSGWVQLDNLFGETLVPAGASSHMAADTPPAVAIYDDAHAGFREAVLAYERTPGDATSVRSIVDRARDRDVLTLLQLVLRYPSAADALLARAAELDPPDDERDIERARSGDRAAVGRWMASLPLPSPKNGWIWNWRDGFGFARDNLR